MYIVPKAKAVLLQLDNPNVVLTTVPSAKMMDGYVAVPHEVPETATLNTIGINVPSPIRYYYEWTGRFKPYSHQVDTASFLTLHKRAIVLNEIGTGKTKSALWAADYLMSEGIIKRVLIISPLSTLERVWGDELFTGFPDRTFAVLHGTAEKRKRLLALDYDFYVINHDGFPIIAKEAIGKFDLVIVDEAAVLRNPTTNRFRMVKKWFDKNPDCRLWLMTGTPTPNSPLDAWALAKLLGNNVGTYTRFKEQVMYKVGQWTWLPKEDAVERVKHILTPAVRFSRDECLDLPDTVIQTRSVELTAEQKRHYQNMMKHFIAEAATGVITAANEAVKAQKLVQIACGVVYDDDKDPVELDCTPRLNIVKEIIEEAGGKVIVFAPLTSALNMLHRELSKSYTCEMVYGAVSASERNRIFNEFQNTENPKVLLAHPATMAHGLTLTTARAIVWYGPITSNEIYTQANGRTERIGKRHVTSVVHIEGTKLEKHMYERLKGKQQMQGILLDLIKEETHG